jgi:uncharacterized membrane protein
MKRKQSLYLCQGAVIAAMYVVLTYFSALMGLSSGAIQVRISEALCILPVFLPAAIPGLTIGCLIANILTGSVALDVIFGTLATFIGALGTYALRKRKYIWLLPPILSNMLIVPVVLKLAYHLEDAYLYLVATVGLGEVISAGILGFILKLALEKNKAALKWDER